MYNVGGARGAMDKAGEDVKPGRGTPVPFRESLRLEATLMGAEQIHSLPGSSNPLSKSL